MPREGTVVLDEGENLVGSDDLHRPVHVRGLLPGDFAVFLSADIQEEAAVGCLVSQVDQATGEGIIIAGDAVEQYPRLWLEKPFIERLRMLQDDEWTDFGLTSLHLYLQSIK